MLKEHKNFLFCLSLFALPLIIGLFVLQFFGNLNNFLFMTPIELRSTIFLRLPFLTLSVQFLQLIVLITTVAIALFYYLPLNYKKNFVFLLCSLYIYARSNELNFLVLWTANLGIWFIIEKASVRVRNALVAMVFISLAVYIRFFPTSQFFEWRVFAQMVAGVIAAIYVKNRSADKLSFTDCFILWSGIPLGFAILIGYNEFKDSFLNTNYIEIFKKSLVRIYLGLSKIFVVGMIQFFLYPEWSAFRPGILAMRTLQAANWFSSSLIWSFAIYGVFLISLVGYLQIVQGIAGLFGYNLKDQTIQPWLSKSLLDFWKRSSFHNREYMLKHVFFPIYIRTRSLYVSMICVWIFWALISAFMTGLLSGGVGPYPAPAMEIFLIVFIKFAVLYAHAAYFEMKMRPYLTKLSGTSKKLLQAGLFILFILLMFVGHEVFPGPFSFNLNKFWEL